LDGITFTYKLDSVIKDLPPKGKMTVKQLEGYLKKRGVSPKEIEASGVLDTFLDRAMPPSYWANMIKSGKHHISTVEAKNLSYGDITLGKKGENTETYKETLSTIKEPYRNAPPVTHFYSEMDNINKKPQQTLLGWRRTHVDTINGKPTTVLNEFQSDWAQAERAGKGVFKKNALTAKDIKKLEQEKAQLDRQYTMYANDFEALPATTIDGVDITKTKEYEDLLNNYEDTKDAYFNMKEKIKEAKTQNVIADFPMSEAKHHQFQIVGAIDEAIKNGTNRVAIPIERENELVGTKGVTKFYNSLNKKILPEIRKKLEKQGMRLKLGKEDYSDTSNTLHIIDIVPVKGKKVNWDVYGVLGSIGLGELADKLKEQEESN